MNSARVFRMWWVVIVLAVATHSARAMLRVYFDIPRASWGASHIVLVKTTDIDGTFEVVESWKGDLVAGSRVVIPELIPPSNAIPLSAYSVDCAKDRCRMESLIPKQPVGSRIVLFLRKNKVEDGTGTKRREWSGWWGAHDADDMNISAVWIEGNKTYSFKKGGSLGEYFILSMRGDWPNEGRHFVVESEEQLKLGVAEQLQMQKEMEAILVQTSGRESALRLKPYATSRLYQRSVLDELSKSGAGAVSTLGAMLDDPVYMESEWGLVNAMVQADRTLAGEELTRRLKQELAFWSSIGPSLSKNWWKQESAPASLRNRPRQTYALVYGLTQANYTDALNTAVELRDLYRAMPWLDQGDDHTMLDACNRLIAKLQSS